MVKLISDVPRSILHPPIHADVMRPHPLLFFEIPSNLQTLRKAEFSRLYLLFLVQHGVGFVYFSYLVLYVGIN